MVQMSLENYFISDLECDVCKLYKFEAEGHFSPSRVLERHRGSGLMISNRRAGILSRKAYPLFNFLTKGRRLLMCPHCKAQITSARIDVVQLSEPDEKTLRGVKYSCPYCGGIISIGIDPLAQANEIVNRIIAGLKS